MPLNWDIAETTAYKNKDKYDNFDFIGPSPIDFDTMVENKCVWPEICNFDLIKHN